VLLFGRQSSPGRRRRRRRREEEVERKAGEREGYYSNNIYKNVAVCCAVVVFIYLQFLTALPRLRRIPRRPGSLGSAVKNCKYIDTVFLFYCLVVVVCSAIFLFY
jgi:hypothetical protein